MKIDIYSDIACPWCYIGKARFEKAIAGFSGEPIEVSYHSYQLDPNAPAVAVPMYDYLAKRFGPNARAMAARVIDTARAEGLEMDYDHGLVVNTFEAHRLLWLVDRDYGPDIQRDVVERLFRAHFAEGKNVGDVEVLTNIALDAGTDGDRVRSFLASDEGTTELRESIALAQQMGVDAVPSYVINEKYMLQGAQPTPVFIQALQQVSREAA